MRTMTWEEISGANEKIAYERLGDIRKLREELEKARKRIMELEELKQAHKPRPRRAGRAGG